MSECMNPILKVEVISRQQKFRPLLFLIRKFLCIKILVKDVCFWSVCATMKCTDFKLTHSNFKEHARVETPIHDSIRGLVTWECKEHGVKS
jgi:hypothetical protein